MVKKLTPKERRRIIAGLSKKRASYISFRKGYLSLKFDGRLLKNRVAIKHDPGLGNWARKKNVIYYDERIQAPDILPVLLHEAVEKYVVQKYGLRTQSESHKVAITVEKRFVSEACSRKYKQRCTHSGRCWRRHEQRLQGWWLAENIRRRKKKGKKRAKSKSRK